MTARRRPASFTANLRPRRTRKYFHGSLFLFVCVASTISAQPSPSAAISPNPTPSPAATATASPSKFSSSKALMLKGMTQSKRWLMSDNVSIKPNNLLRILNILAAVLIGSLGALAFYAGVKFGFISPESRRRLLLYLPDERYARPSRNYFYFLGGVVAGIFQWAQPDVLAPIQAFVLGATWPSVVTRIMSGSGNLPSGPSLDDILNKPPPPDAGGPLKDAVVIIKRSGSAPAPASGTGKIGQADVKVSPGSS